MKLALIFIFLAGLNSTLGNLLLKASRIKLSPNSSLIEQYASPFFLGAMVFYGLNVIIFAKALDHLPVSVGYPILAASSFGMLSILSWLILGERLTGMQTMGICVVLIGIFLLAYTPPT